MLDCVNDYVDLGILHCGIRVRFGRRAGRSSDLLGRPGGETESRGAGKTAEILSSHLHKRRN